MTITRTLHYITVTYITLTLYTCDLDCVYFMHLRRDTSTVSTVVKYLAIIALRHAIISNPIITSAPSHVCIQEHAVSVRGTWPRTFQPSSPRMGHRGNRCGDARKLYDRRAGQKLLAVRSVVLRVVKSCKQKGGQTWGSWNVVFTG